MSELPKPNTDPSPGDAVWVLVNGEPALRYFSEFYSDGVRLAFDRTLSQVVFFERSRQSMYARKSDLLTLQCEGLEHTIHRLKRDLADRIRQRDEALASEGARPRDASRQSAAARAGT